MLTKRLTMRVMAGLTLWAGVGGTVQAQLPPVTPENACKMLPRQPGVNVSTPNAAQIAQCTAAPIPNPKDPKATMGYVIRDAANKPIRQFVSYDGKSYNIIAFYLDGVEAYREVYPPSGDYQFRWLGPNGTKFGLDKDRDGKVDEWVVISPEELSQELLQAVLTNDPKRIEALTLKKADLDTIGFQGPEAQKLLDRAAGSAKQLGQAAAALKAGPDAKWDHLQLGIPQSTPFDAIGAKDDIIVHKNGTIMVQDGTTAKFLQTGEMVLINRAWKLVDGPSVGAAGGPANATPAIPDAVRDLVAQLDKIDRDGPANPPTAANVAAYNAKRAQVLEQIVSKLDGKQQEAWMQMLVDALAGAVDGEQLNGKHIARLLQLKNNLEKGPNPALAAYAAYHYLVAENSVALANAKPGDLPTIQNKFRDSLEEFVKKYPTVDDAPEAMLRLAMAFEFEGKEGETKAKEWYARLEQTKHPHAAKAAGALRRLNSDGKPIELTGPNLANGQAFNVAALNGKVVVVYYWASWSSTLAADAQRLKALVKDYGAKGLELVTVCLDNDAKMATQSVNAHGIPGTHLFAPGGLDSSALAAHYGILVVPHLFVVDKTGKIANRNAQTANLEDEVKKLLP